MVKPEFIIFIVRARRLVVNKNVKTVVGGSGHIARVHLRIMIIHGT